MISSYVFVVAVVAFLPHFLVLCSFTCVCVNLHMVYLQTKTNPAFTTKLYRKQYNRKLKHLEIKVKTKERER